MSELRRHIMMQQAGGEIPLLAIQGVNAFLNLGLQVDSTIDIDIKCSKTDPVSSNLYGGGADVWMQNTGVEIAGFYFNYGGKRPNINNWDMGYVVGFSDNLNDWVRIQMLHTGECRYESKRLPSGMRPFDTTSFVGNPNFPLLLNAIWRGNTPYIVDIVKKRFYHFKINKSGVPVLDLVPCIKGGRVGMKDLLTDMFFASENPDEEFEPIYE